MRISYSLSNYRCFPDSSQASIVIEQGFTSFIGLNNAGKSTLLRSLYEFRPMFSNLSSPSAYWISGAIGSGLLGLVLNGIPDQDDVFTDGNSRDLQVELAVDQEVGQAGLRVPERVVLTVNRTDKTYIVEIGAGDGTQLVRPSAFVMYNGVQALQLANNQPCDLAPYLEACAVLANTLY